MTGRAAGYCAGYPVPGFMNPVPGRGFWGWGRGFWGRGAWGRGRGWRNWYWATGLPGWARWGAAAWTPGAFPPYAAAAYTATAAPEVELQHLRTQADYFRSALDEIQKRIEELKTSGAKQE